MPAQCIPPDTQILLESSLQDTDLSINDVAGTESPRPISRIRTNFIAIEKDGRLGLQRDNSRDSSVSGVSTRKLSGDLETPSLSRTTSQDNTSAPAENKRERTPMRRTSLKEQPIPESPLTESIPQMPSLPLPKSPNGKPSLAPPINPDKTVDEEEVDTTMAPVGGTTDKGVVNGSSSPLPNGGHGKTTKGAVGEKDKGKGKAVTKEAPKDPPSTSKPTVAKTLAPVNTTSTTTTKSTKSPTVTKPLKSPAKMATPKLASKTTDRSAAHPEKSSTPKAATSTAKLVASASSKPAASAPTLLASSSVKRPPPLQAAPANTGFVKPKVKSPTRPVKLPAGLTTHTAASATKFNVPRHSLTGGDKPTEEKHRANSRASISSTATRTPAATAGKTLKRQSSTVSRPRPSIGPPPKQTAKDHPLTKKEAHVDEGFLARMMRPTAASASKTHDKPPSTPPKKTAAAPIIKAAVTPVVKKAVQAVHVAETKVVKAAKAVTQPAKPAASTSGHGEKSSSAKEVAPVVEKIATAEEAVEVAKKIDGPAALPEEAKPTETKPDKVKSEKPETKVEQPEVQVNKFNESNTAETKPEDKKPTAATPEEAKQTPPIKVIAPVVEQLESAEEVIEAAKDIDGEVALPAEAEKEEHKDEDTTAEVAEETPSEATLVNGSHDKTVPAELAEPVEEAVKAVHAEEKKLAKESEAKEEVAV